MSAGEWIAFAALLLTLIGGGFTAWNSLRNEIRDSRHKTMSDMQPKFAGIDEDIDELRKDLNALGQRVAKLEERRGSD